MDIPKVQRIILKIIKSCLLLLAVLFLILQLTDPNYDKIGGILAGFVLPFLPEIFGCLFKTKFSVRIELAYYIFIFLSLDLGICLYWYETVPYYDKFVHMLSGVFSAVIAYYVLLYFGAKYTHKGFRRLFIICFSLAVAVCWEFFEFFCDKVLGQHMQELIQHGVDDTMWDLIMAFIGSLVGGFLFVHKRPQQLVAPAEVTTISQAQNSKKSKKSSKKSK